MAQNHLTGPFVELPDLPSAGQKRELMLQQEDKGFNR